MQKSPLSDQKSSHLSVTFYLSGQLPPPPTGQSFRYNLVVLSILSIFDRFRRQDQFAVYISPPPPQSLGMIDYFLLNEREKHWDVLYAVEGL